VQSEPGERLRRLRSRTGLSTRKVAGYSLAVARDRGSREFAISHARLVQIENGRSAPSIQKLFTLAVIYGVPLSDVLAPYVNPGDAGRLHAALSLPETHLVAAEFEPFLRRTAQTECCYAAIGLDDFTMSPLVRPGSTVEIDPSDTMPRPAPWPNEFERPIYFLKTRTGSLCCWCETAPGQLIAVPHPLSGCRTRIFAWPRDVEIVGRVTAVTARLVAPTTG
jgi:transcriptional regulator with XRE-family HTH domain